MSASQSLFTWHHLIQVYQIRTDSVFSLLPSPPAGQMKVMVNQLGTRQDTSELQDRLYGHIRLILINSDLLCVQTLPGSWINQLDADFNKGCLLFLNLYDPYLLLMDFTSLLYVFATYMWAHSSLSLLFKSVEQMKLCLFTADPHRKTRHNSTSFPLLEAPP